MTDPIEPSEVLSGHPVMDTYLDKVGVVTDVLFDEHTSTGRWAVVKAGLFRGERLVPLHDSYLDDTGRLVMPLTKSTIQHAPKPGRTHALTAGVRKALREYYGVAA